jgi:hypothetical protein
LGLKEMEALAEAVRGHFSYLVEDEGFTWARFSTAGGRNAVRSDPGRQGGDCVETWINIDTLTFAAGAGKPQSCGTTRIRPQVKGDNG